jgi:phospholipid-translocating ATPase
MELVTLNWTRIAPRFIVKYWTTVYFPLDKDIIREMWVKGDLKDQLGLSHRKVKKNKIMSDSNLEAAPMFVDAHGRSLSDLHHNYDPAIGDSPPYAASSTRQTTYTDTPPMTDIIELLPRELGVQYAQPITKSKPSELEVSPPMNDAPSPKASYYSVTDIPIPSPLPSPKFQLPSGEITTSPPSRRPSIATSRATTIRGRGPPLTPPTSTSPLPSHPLPSGSSLPIPPQMYGNRRASAGYSGSSYEMQSYEEQARGYSSGRTSQTSNSTSFATAEDFWIGEEGASSPNYAYQHTQMLHTPSPQLDWFDAQQSQPQADEDDRSTIVADSRRGSVSDTWEGGQAM